MHALNGRKQLHVTSAPSTKYRGFVHVTKFLHDNYRQLEERGNNGLTY